MRWRTFTTAVARKSLSQPFFRFGFGASRSIPSRFFDLNGFTLTINYIMILENLMVSMKPFKSKNRDKIDLDAPNPNLKKGCDRDFLRQPNL